MTRIDFYILKDESIEARQVFAARLVEKAYRLGNKIFVHTPDPGTAQQFDQFLWTFRDGSFVPHCLDGVEDERFSPIHIGQGQEPHSTPDLLVNLDNQVPLFFSRFERTAEIVCGASEQKKLGRERFKFYKDRGYNLEVHNL